MTSSEVMVNTPGTPTGTCSSLISRTPSRCWMCHIHCLPITKISVEAEGGREFSKYKLEAQRNKPAQMNVGMMVHANSSGRFSSVSRGISLSVRLRYFTMKTKIVEKMAMVKNSVMKVRTK